VIDAWSRRSGKDTAQRAEKVLDRMIQHYELTGNKLLRPDVISFTSVMKAYVGHPNGGKKVVKMLEEMNKQCKEGNLQAKADAKTISVAIDACVKSGLVEDASRLLNEVEDKYKNIVMVNTLLSAYKGHGSQGEALLRKMIDLSNQGYSNCSPDSTTYALCISAVSIYHC
jgi:pentatricopeptide repeat protein